jgi:hypothetical protein
MPGMAIHIFVCRDGSDCQTVKKTVSSVDAGRVGCKHIFKIFISR